MSFTLENTPEMKLRGISTTPKNISFPIPATFSQKPFSSSPKISFILDHLVEIPDTASSIPERTELIKVEKDNLTVTFILLHREASSSIKVSFASSVEFSGFNQSLTT